MSFPSVSIFKSLSYENNLQIKNPVNCTGRYLHPTLTTRELWPESPVLVEARFTATFLSSIRAMADEKVGPVAPGEGQRC